MTKTKNGSGILVFILVSERNFELLADRGVIAVLPEEYWTKAAERLSKHFSENNFYHGVKTALAEVGEVLESKLPPIAGSQEELPNDVIEE